MSFKTARTSVKHRAPMLFKFILSITCTLNELSEKDKSANGYGRLHVRQCSLSPETWNGIGPYKVTIGQVSQRAGRQPVVIRPKVTDRYAI